MITLPVLLGVVSWTGALFVVLAAVVVSVLAIRMRQPALALFGLLPIGLGILGLALGVNVPETPVLPALVALGLGALGVLGGNPLAVWALQRATRDDIPGGEHGGILVPATTASGAPSTTKKREVLRGGTWIGYLERVAVVGAIAVGRFEIVAAVIAIKGLGRFSELDTPETRERFIIGTLVSMIWAGVCGALIVLAGLLPFSL